MPVLKATETTARRMIVFENDFCSFAARCRAIKNGQFKMSFKNTTLVLFLFLTFQLSAESGNEPVLPGAYNTSAYIPVLKGKNVGIVANHTSMLGGKHLVDSLLKLGIKITRIFGPEHGFRGDAANGEHVSDSKDPVTGIPVVSLYGKHREPTHEDFAGIDIMVFDLQDVGVRFYTHLTTLHHVMNRCAEEKVPLIVLDRPNPNGYYTDGPILKPEFKSDVGVHPIPLVHGMTLGELALMINGEKWLRNGQNCDVTVISIVNWNHNRKYVLPIAPSPNLASAEAIIAYPTMGLFEGIDISVGRGTPHPFECFGAPWLRSGTYIFFPVEIPGKTMNPPYEGDTCYGYYIADFARNYLIDYKKLYIEWLELLVAKYPEDKPFFRPFFDKLAGTDQLRIQLQSHTPIADIRKSWEPGLKVFKEQRRKYLLYSFDENLGLTW